MHRHPSMPLYRALLFALLLAAGSAVHASDPTDGEAAPPLKKPYIDLSSSSNAKEAAERVRAALGTSKLPPKRLTLTIRAHSDDKMPATGEAPATSALPSRQYQRARARAMGVVLPAVREAEAPVAVVAMRRAEVAWSYAGDTGPADWGALSPAFGQCASGMRQSPIAIADDQTLLGPAEPIRFDYQPGSATVVNTGHSIRVELQGDSSITVRGSNFHLQAAEFHAPGEMQINNQRAPLSIELLHQNAEGQSAIVALQLLPGEQSNAVVDTIATYLPLDVGDRVRIPTGLLKLSELLPSDLRYYQFLGSLSVPPCTEGVLWLVLKQPIDIGKGQYRLFTQLYPDNARPLQPLNGRPVREAQ